MPFPLVKEVGQVAPPLSAKTQMVWHGFRDPSPAAASTMEPQHPTNPG